MYETYAGRVLAVCRRYIRDPERARDLVHDTFLKAWDALDGFSPRREGSLGAWLGRIASHLAVDELRRQKHLTQLTGGPVDAEDSLDDSLLDTSAVDQPDPSVIRRLDRRISQEEATVDTERLRQVPVEELIDLIASLPEGYRAVFNLFCLDGCAHREIAQLLGISEKTSQTQYLKARHKLAAMIAAKYGSHEKEQ